MAQVQPAYSTLQARASKRPFCARSTACHQHRHPPTRHRGKCTTAATQKRDPTEEEQDRRSNDQLVVGASSALLALGAALALTVGREPIEDFLYSEAMSSSGGFGSGDWLAAALWSGSLWFCSPLQLLLLFLGQIETERPSDWAMGILGRASGLPVDDVDYSAPLWLRAIVAALCGASGVAVAWLCSSGLGDATWGVAGGVGATFAAGIYEIGRPQRLSGEEAVALEMQWQDFAMWADQRLQRGGQCHESEIAAAFRGASPRYRDPSALPNDTLRTMVRNWHPDAKRSSSGYYKNVSLRPRSDPFTGEQTGMVVGAGRTAAGAGARVDGAAEGGASGSGGTGGDTAGG